MKLLSILNVLEDEQEIRVLDEHRPITDALLFEGTAGDCKKVGRIRNGVVTTIIPIGKLDIVIDIEYQKRKAHKEEQKNETIQHRASKQIPPRQVCGSDKRRNS